MENKNNKKDQDQFWQVPQTAEEVEALRQKPEYLDACENILLIKNKYDYTRPNRKLRDFLRNMDQQYSNGLPPMDPPPDDFWEDCKCAMCVAEGHDAIAVQKGDGSWKYYHDWYEGDSDPQLAESFSQGYDQGYGDAMTIVNKRFKDLINIVDQGVKPRATPNKGGKLFD